jgi:RNA polymerase sigma-70 factor, ECF subfamily
MPDGLSVMEPLTDRLEAAVAERGYLVRPQGRQVKRSAAECADEVRLVDACQRGEAEAWDRFVRKYYRVILALAFVRCKDRDDAADVAGEVLRKVYESIGAYRNEGSLCSWLYFIVKNVFVDTYVRSTRLSTVSLSAPGEASLESAWDLKDTALLPDEAAIAAEDRALLWKAIRELPAYQRDVIERYHLDGRTYEEIASETGLHIGTVKSRLARARRMLRSRLGAYGDALPA